MDATEIKFFVESALLAAGRPLSVAQLQDLFDGRSTPEKSQIRQAISSLLEDYEGRGITIKEVAICKNVFRPVDTVNQTDPFASSSRINLERGSKIEDRSDSLLSAFIDYKKK